MKYLKSKSGSLENSILSVWSEAAKKEGNAFGQAVTSAKEKGDKSFVFAGKKYDVEETLKRIKETNKNDKSDDGEGMDAVQPKAVKKKFKDRKDKDIDNDGDVDDSDKFLHKRRKAVSKAISKENFEVGTKARTDHTLKVTPGQSPEEFDQQVSIMHKKKNSMREALAKMWGIKEGKNPFDKKEEEGYNKVKNKKEGKTLTGKAETKVEVEPKMEKKK